MLEGTAMWTGVDVLILVGVAAALAVAVWAVVRIWRRRTEMWHYDGGNAYQKGQTSQLEFHREPQPWSEPEAESLGSVLKRLEKLLQEHGQRLSRIEEVVLALQRDGRHRGLPELRKERSFAEAAQRAQPLYASKPPEGGDSIVRQFCEGQLSIDDLAAGADDAGLEWGDVDINAERLRFHSRKKSRVIGVQRDRTSREFLVVVDFNYLESAEVRRLFASATAGPGAILRPLGVRTVEAAVVRIDLDGAVSRIRNGRYVTLSYPGGLER